MAVDEMKRAFVIHKIITFRALGEMYGGYKPEEIKPAVDAARRAVYGDEVSIASLRDSVFERF